MAGVTASIRGPSEENCRSSVLNVLKRPVLVEENNVGWRIFFNVVVFASLVAIAVVYGLHFLEATPFEQAVVQNPTFEQFQDLNQQRLPRFQCPCVSPRLAVAQAIPTLQEVVETSTLFQQTCMTFPGWTEFELLVSPDVYCQRFQQENFMEFFQAQFGSEVQVELPLEDLDARVKQAVVSGCLSAVSSVDQYDARNIYWYEQQLSLNNINPSSLGLLVYLEYGKATIALTKFLQNSCVNGTLHDQLLNVLPTSQQALFDNCASKFCTYAEYQDTLWLILTSANKALAFALITGFFVRILFNFIVSANKSGCCRNMRTFWKEEIANEDGNLNILGEGLFESVDISPTKLIFINSLIYVALVGSAIGLLWYELDGPRGWVVREVSSAVITVDRLSQDTPVGQTPITCECVSPVPLQSLIGNITTRFPPERAVERCFDHIEELIAIDEAAKLLDQLGMRDVFLLQCWSYDFTIFQRLVLGDNSLRHLPTLSQFLPLATEFYESRSDPQQWFYTLESTDFWVNLGTFYASFENSTLSNDELQAALAVVAVSGGVARKLTNISYHNATTSLINTMPPFSELFELCRPRNCLYTEEEDIWAILQRLVPNIVLGFALACKILVQLCYFCFKNDNNRAPPICWKKFCCCLWLGPGPLNYLFQVRRKPAPDTRERCHVTVSVLAMVIAVTVVVVGVLYYPSETEEVRIQQPTLEHTNENQDQTSFYCPCEVRSTQVVLRDSEKLWMNSTERNVLQACTLQQPNFYCQSFTDWTVRSIDTQTIKLPVFLSNFTGFEFGFSWIPAGVMSMITFDQTLLFRWLVLFKLTTLGIPCMPRTGSNNLTADFLQSQSFGLEFLNKFVIQNMTLTVDSFSGISEAVLFASCKPPQCTYLQPRHRAVQLGEVIVTFFALFLLVMTPIRWLRDCKAQPSRARVGYGSVE